MSQEKIYFCGSIRAGQDDQPIYKVMVDHMNSHYGNVLTFHVAQEVKTCDLHATEEEIFERDVGWLKEATCVVAEVTIPSLGVGYELGRGHVLGLPTLCLFRVSKDTPSKKLSAMIRGCKDFKVVDYETIDQALAAIDEFFKAIKH